jgi:hypothetical protein
MYSVPDVGSPGAICVVVGLVGACQKSKMKFAKLIFAAALVPRYASSKREVALRLPFAPTFQPSTGTTRTHISCW